MAGTADILDVRETTSPTEPQNAGPLLEAQHLGRRVPSTDRWLLRNITLSVDAGVRLGIVGPSGSGKSLLLRALALLDPFDEGTITWQGAPAGSTGVPDYRRHVMYLHQQPALFEGDVEANLKQPFALKIHATARFAKDIVLALMGDIGRTPDFLQKRARELSGGERQIVVLIRALQLRPTILLLDEPTASLDTGAKEAVERLLSKWLSDAQAHRAIVQVTHDVSQVERIAQRVVEMDRGALKERH